MPPTIRRLTGSPVFALFAIVTLAVAIGASTAIFSIVRVVTGPPPGIADADRVLEVYHFPEGSMPITTLSWEDYQDLRARQTAFEALTGFTIERPALVAGGTAETGLAEVVDGDYFRTTRARIVIGRPLQPADDRPDAPAAAVISTAFHARVFGASNDVLGRTIAVAGSTFTVVGVVGPEFTGLFNGGLISTSVWIPMSAGRRAFPGLAGRFASGARAHRWVFVRGRLAPGQTMNQARAQVETIAHQLDAEVPLIDGTPSSRAPWDSSRPWGVRRPTRVLGVPSALMRGLTWTLSGAIVLVLLVACTNIANLMVARHTRRLTEMAVRRALGASRQRLIVEAMLEPLVLASAGGLAGLLVARAFMAVLSTPLSIGGFTLQAIPRLDWAALVAALGATALAAVVAGAIPAWRATGRRLQPLLSSRAAGGTARWRGRRYLIAVQVSVSVLLVSLATLFAAQLRHQREMDFGIDLDHLALAEVEFASQRYEPARSIATAEAAAQRVHTRPGVIAAAVVSGLPFGSFAQAGNMALPDAPPVRPGTFAARTPGRAITGIVAGDERLFDALGVTVTSGRAFRTTGGDGSIEAVLSNRTASELFPAGQAIGRETTLTVHPRIAEAGTQTLRLTIVGIASDTDASLAGRRAYGVVYIPLDERQADRLVVLARTSGDPAPTATAIRQALRTVAPDLAVTRAGTGVTLAGPETAFPRIAGTLAALLGVLALVVALAGLYGVLSHVVGSRTREIGVRMALGAGAPGIRRMVVVDGMRPIAVGLVAGLGFGAIARTGIGLVQPAFDRVLPGADVMLLAGVPLLFVAAGLVACYLPALRASRVDPNVALRHE